MSSIAQLLFYTCKSPFYSLTAYWETEILIIDSLQKLVEVYSTVRPQNYRQKFDKLVLFIILF